MSTKFSIGYCFKRNNTFHAMMMDGAQAHAHRAKEATHAGKLVDVDKIECEMPF